MGKNSSSRRRYLKLAEKYSNGAESLQSLSNEAASFLSSSQERINAIRIGVPNSYGDVVSNFEEIVGKYMKEIDKIMDDMNASKNDIERAISDAKDIADDYRRMADDC